MNQTSGSANSGGFTPSHRGGSGPPMVLVHGFTDTWRGWELVLPELEKHHDVLAVTMPGHAGGPPVEGPVTATTLVEGVERAMDEAGFEIAAIVGNSLGGFVSLQLASRGRAGSVVALSPAGGWVQVEGTRPTSMEYFRTLREMVTASAPFADAIAANPDGRRAATRMITENFEHIPPDLVAHQIRGVAACEMTLPFVDFAEREGFELEAGKIDCPVRIVWGTKDQVLPWPSAAERFRNEWLPQADLVVMEGVGHCPQLDVPLETVQLILGFPDPA